MTPGAILSQSFVPLWRFAILWIMAFVTLKSGAPSRPLAIHLRWFSNIHVSDNISLYTPWVSHLKDSPTEFQSGGYPGGLVKVPNFSEHPLKSQSSGTPMSAARKSIDFAEQRTEAQRGKLF